eukprot:CAMPEP_0198111338 /NCGR_PEP_ID=MMETSP1442-20131203/3305_1 /TAXON_ID= /ORGANISM="Craspedostauros australis, Strain CCMP3328" /LENGTH=47 /DNA_ID= /DNA_START= /DNA_END= /DNA_ORIENTATION=
MITVIDDDDDDDDDTPLCISILRLYSTHFCILPLASSTVLPQSSITL